MQKTHYRNLNRWIAVLLAFFPFGTTRIICCTQCVWSGRCRKDFFFHGNLPKNVHYIILNVLMCLNSSKKQNPFFRLRCSLSYPCLCFSFNAPRPDPLRPIDCMHAHRSDFHRGGRESVFLVLPQCFYHYLCFHMFCQFWETDHRSTPFVTSIVPLCIHPTFMTTH